MDDDTVAVFAYEHDIGTVDNDLLVIHSVADEYLERFRRVLGSLLYGILYELAGIDYCIET